MSVWYREGLRFECTGCGKCCGGGPGVVWVDQEEIRLIAEHLSMHPDDLWGRVIYRIGSRVSLLERSSGDCVFLKRHPDGARSCSIYALRPQQCRTWPFWSCNLKSRPAWEEAARACKGINAGRLYSVEQAEAIRKSPPWYKRPEGQRDEAVRG